MENPTNPQAYFESLYQSHVDELFGFCVSKVRHRDEALDIVQETFIKLWRMISAGQQIPYPRALLYTMVRNRIIDHYRSVALQRVFPISEELAESLSDPGQNITESMDLKLILQAINTLPDQPREILLYRYIDGLPTNEIADILKISPNATSQKVKRAVGLLRKKLNIDN